MFKKYPLRHFRNYWNIFIYVTFIRQKIYYCFRWAFKHFIKNALYKEDFKEFKIPKGIYLTSLNYDTGIKSSLGDKNTIIEALKSKDINNIDNNNLISINSYDKLIKYRQFY